MTFALTAKRTVKFLAATESTLADAWSGRGAPARSVTRASLATRRHESSLVSGRGTWLYIRCLLGAMRDKAAARPWSARIVLGGQTLGGLRH